MPAGEVGGDTQVMFKSKIVKVLSGARIGNAENVLTNAWPSRVKGTDNNINGAVVDRMVGLIIGSMEKNKISKKRAIGV